jgi:hypothetical protein
MTDTKKQVFFNAPAWEEAKDIADVTPKPKRFPLTLHMRIAINEVFADKEKYETFINYYKGGEISGSAHLDRGFLANQIVQWEKEDKRFAIANAIADKSIKLTDVSSAITKDLRVALGYTVERGMITGRIAKDS